MIVVWWLVLKTENMHHKRHSNFILRTDQLVDVGPGENKGPHGFVVVHKHVQKQRAVGVSHVATEALEQCCKRQLHRWL